MLAKQKFSSCSVRLTMRCLPLCITNNVTSLVIQIIVLFQFLRWADTTHTRVHVAGTCRSDIKQRQQFVYYTLRRHVSGTCSRDKIIALAHTLKCCRNMSQEHVATTRPLV